MTQDSKADLQAKAAKLADVAAAYAAINAEAAGDATGNSAGAG